MKAPSIKRKTIREVDGIGAIMAIRDNGCRLNAVLGGTKSRLSRNR